MNFVRRRYLAYAVIFSLVTTSVTILLTFFADPPSISTADIHGCSLPRD